MPKARGVPTCHYVRPSRNPQIKGVNCDHFSNITSYETPIKKSLPALLPYQPVVLAVLHYGITCAFSVGDSTLVLYNIGTDWFDNFVVVNKYSFIFLSFLF